jgi:neutral ceramidase
VGRTNRALTRRDFVAAAGAALVGRTSAVGKDSTGERNPPKLPPLRAGAAAVDITPPLGASLDGIIMQIGPAREIHDRLYARCIVLDDGRMRVAVVVCDLTIVCQMVFDKAKAIAREHTGIPTDRMLMSATHTHMAPRVIGAGKSQLDKEYYETLAQRIADAVSQALKNLAPATVGWGAADEPRFVHNRRWLMKPGTVPPNPFGSNTEQVVMGGRPEANRLKPAGPVDPQVSVLSLRHADGPPLAVLANYGIHYAGYKAGLVSADYYGHFARCVGPLLDADKVKPPFVGMMSNGTSGNVGKAEGGFETIAKVGEALAATAAAVCRRIEHRDRVTLAMREMDLELSVRRPDEARLQWARQLCEQARDEKRLTRPEIYAREVIELSTFPPKVSLKLQALRIGGMGIVALPCEVFAETGLAVKKQSPLASTCVISLANGYGGYLPTARQHELGGYETWPARSSFLQVEAESAIRAAALDLLRQVAPSSSGRS